MTILASGDLGTDVDVDIVFFSTPDGVGMNEAQQYLDKGVKVIDYSGDFRFNSALDYADYAGRLGKPAEHHAESLLSQSVYGLPELGLSDFGQADLVGNPGCFAASVLLGAAPLLANDLIVEGSLIADCKTGVSGAGKKPAPGFHYPARYDNMNAYRLSGHQHVCEVEKQLGKLSGNEQPITFTSQVVPATRGIMSCIYAKANDNTSAEALKDLYESFYAGKHFVRVYDASADIGTANVRGSNFCNITVSKDERTGTFRVVSYIDNLMKGQAGNALQVMNLLLGLPEEMGLDAPGQYP